MSENPRRGRQARNFKRNVPKILDLKSFPNTYFPKMSLGDPDGKLLLTPLRVNDWNQNLHGLHMKCYIQEWLSVVFLFLRVLFMKTMKNVFCLVYISWYKHERVLREFKRMGLGAFITATFPRKKLQSSLFMELIKVIPWFALRISYCA